MSEVVENSGEPWELYYWANIKEDGKNHMIGRGEFVRLMFELAGVTYIDHGVLPNGGATVFQFVRGGKNNGFPVFAPPVIKRGEFVLSQTPAIMKFLGKEFGFYPTNKDDEAYGNKINIFCSNLLKYLIFIFLFTADSLIAFATDFVAEGRLVFHSKSFTASYHDQVEEVKPTIAWFENTRMPQFLAFMESVLKYNATKYGTTARHFVGESLTFVDVSMFHVVTSAANQFPTGYEAIKDTIPLIEEFRTQFSSIPNIANYLQSDRRGFFEGNSMM
jgi:glutathione S-transferase